MTALKLGIPAKGRLRASVFDWLEGIGLGMSPGASEREYSGQVNGISNVEPVFLTAGEMPDELEAGRIHLGVTGQDLVRERLPLAGVRVAELLPLGFGFADLVVAVPSGWIDCRTVDDLDSVAAGFRENHGMRLRIATKYHNLVRAFLAERELADYQLVDSQGATEATVRNLTAEAVADIAASGKTLRANHLRALDDGIVLSSQAALFAGRNAPWPPEARTALHELARRAGFEVSDGVIGGSGRKSRGLADSEI